jgi:hypothetical protein
MSGAGGGGRGPDLGLHGAGVEVTVNTWIAPEMSKQGKRKGGITPKREKGRPAVADLLVGLRLPIETRQAVLEWAKNQAGQPNLSDAIRKLIDIGLSGTAAKTPEKMAAEPVNFVQPDDANSGRQREPDTSPKVETGNQRPKAEVERKTPIRWTPKAVEAGPKTQAAKSLAAISALALRPSPKAQPVIRRTYDGKSYPMPEDVRAFNEYWMQTERRLGRRLDYEEIIVLFNQDRWNSNYFIED